MPGVPSWPAELLEVLAGVVTAKGVGVGMLNTGLGGGSLLLCLVPEESSVVSLGLLLPDGVALLSTLLVVGDGVALEARSELCLWAAFCELVSLEVGVKEAASVGDLHGIQKAHLQT